MKSAVIPASALVAGHNTLDLSMSGISKNGGIMYDVIKLESTTGSGVSSMSTGNGTDIYEIYSIQGAFVGSFNSLSGLNLPSGIYVYRHGAKTAKFIVK